MLGFPVLLSGVLGFYNWVHEPLFDRRAVARETSAQLQAELRLTQTRLSREGDLASRRAQVTTREQTVDAWVPGKNSAGLLIWHLSQVEQHSGARIRSLVVTDRKEMEVQPAQAEPASPAPPGSTQPTLTVIQIDLKVDGWFVEHLLFNQGVEQMPLFLNIDGLSLVRAEKIPVDRVSEMVSKGDLSAAQRLLGAYPVVEGEYQLNLYFKGEKAGPSKGTMLFGNSPGRVDPFVISGIDEFIQMLNAFYANPGAFEELHNRPGYPYQPGYTGGQLG